MNLACMLLLVAVADVESGPKAGDAVAKLPAFAVVGKVEGKVVDFAAERKDAPTVYLFVTADKFSRPMARFLRELDEKLTDVDGAEGVAVWVGGEADKSKEYLPRAQMSLNFVRTALAVSESATGPDGWALNADAHLTAVVAVGGKVVKSFAFESVNETDVKPVLEELKKATKK